MRIDAGFTLVELLLAIAISAMIAVAGWVGLDAAIQADAALRVQVARVAEVQRAFDLLSADLGQVRARAVTNRDGVVDPAFVADDGGDVLLAFTRVRMALPDESGNGLVQRVEYLWRDGRLWRRHWSYADPSVAAPDPEGTVVLEAAGHVAVRVLPPPLGASRLDDFDLERVATGWDTRWDSGLRPPGQAPLPLAVELTLQLDDLGEVRRVFALPQ